MQKIILAKLDTLFIHQGVWGKIEIFLDRILFHFFFKFYYRKRFKAYGNNIRWGKNFAKRIIPYSVRLSCLERIEIGDNVCIDEGVYLQCDNGNKNSEIKIGNGVRVNAHTHILSGDKIEIGDEVLIAPFTLIASNNHRHELTKSIMHQGMVPSGPIIIERGAWIAQGAFILGGSTIKELAVVGAGVKISKMIVEKGNKLK